MTFAADIKTALQALTKKDHDNPTLKRIVRRYCKAHGHSNPWDAELNPDEHAAWPTFEERAKFMVKRMRNGLKADVGRFVGREHDENNQADRDAAVEAAQDEI